MTVAWLDRAPITLLVEGRPSSPYTPFSRIKGDPLIQVHSLEVRLNIHKSFNTSVNDDGWMNVLWTKPNHYPFSPSNPIRYLQRGKLAVYMDGWSWNESNAHREHYLRMVLPSLHTHRTGPPKQNHWSISTPCCSDYTSTNHWACLMKKIKWCQLTFCGTNRRTEYGPFGPADTWPNPPNTWMHFLNGSITMEWLDREPGIEPLWPYTPNWSARLDPLIHIHMADVTLYIHKSFKAPLQKQKSSEAEGVKKENPRRRRRMYRLFPLHPNQNHQRHRWVISRGPWPWNDQIVPQDYSLKRVYSKFHKLLFDWSCSIRWSKSNSRVSNLRR